MFLTEFGIQIVRNAPHAKHADSSQPRKKKLKIMSHLAASHNNLQIAACIGDLTVDCDWAIEDAIDKACAQSARGMACVWVDTRRSGKPAATSVAQVGSRSGTIVVLRSEMRAPVRILV